MENKMQLLVAVLVLALVVLACGSSSDPGVQVNTPASGLGNDQPAVAATAQPGTARSNPAPAGSEVVMDDMAFQILGIIRPADSIVAAGNMFNTTPEPAQEYLFVEVQVTCKKSADEKCSINPTFSMNALGSKGVEYDPEFFLSGVEKLLEATEFYGNAVVTGYVPFIVGKDETGFVLVYDPFLGDRFYLAIPE